MILSLFITKLSQINRRPLPGWACALLTKHTKAFDRTTTPQFGVTPDIREFNTIKNTSFVGCDITIGHPTTHGPPPEMCSTLLASPTTTCSTHMSVDTNGQMVMFQPLWTHLARLVDRLCFFIYILIETVAVISLIIVAVTT